MPIGHFAPYDMGADIVADAEEQLRRAVRSLEVDNCAINADFILCKGKTYVLEIGARAGATCLVEMTSLYYGFDYYEKIIQCNLGEKPDFTPQAAPQPNAEMLFQAPVTGKITDIDLSGVTPVSYTHLDVYKRQGRLLGSAAPGGSPAPDPAPGCAAPGSSPEKPDPVPVSYTHLCQAECAPSRGAIVGRRKEGLASNEDLNG